MKQITVCFIIFSLLSCTSNPEAYIEHLNGYWEIEKATLADGSNRTYNYNDTIDFISINDSLIGFRKKLKPNLLGTFQTSNDSELLKVVIEQDSLNLYYETPFSQWKETVLKATSEKLIIQNERKDVYLYKRYQPLDLN